MDEFERVAADPPRPNPAGGRWAFLGLALFVAVPALALGVVYGGTGGPAKAVAFAAGEDPYADGLRVTDRRVDDPRVMVGPSPLYDGQDEAAALLNDWQRTDHPNYFAAR